jgi:D-alanine-D-alanine ligase
MDLRKATIGVLYGGPSAERQVSIKSGAAIADALEDSGFLVQRVLVSADFEFRFSLLDIDVAVLGLHGAYGEDGGIQTMLERWGIPYTGSGADASRAAFDKELAKSRFRDAGLATPDAIAVRSLSFSERFGVGRLGWPMVVKPNANGSSIGVSLARNARELHAAIASALEFDERVLIEQFVPGREMTVGILGDAALPVVEIRTPREFFNYDAKYQDRETQYLCPAPLDEASAASVQQTALAAHKALGCRDYSRVDIIVAADGTQYVLEVNTLPGMTDHSLLPKAAAASGLTFAGLCERIMRMAAERSGLYEADAA